MSERFTPPPPRYDEVYFHGMLDLDAEGMGMTDEDKKKAHEAIREYFKAEGKEGK